MPTAEPENIGGRLHCPLRGQHQTNGKICDDNKGLGWKEYASCRRHLRNHDNENEPLYTCGLQSKDGTICQFKSNHSATMFAHRNGGKHVSPDKFQFQCEVCKARFPLRQALERHSSKHTKAPGRRTKKAKNRESAPWDITSPSRPRLAKRRKRTPIKDEIGSIETMLNLPPAAFQSALSPNLGRFMPGSTRVDSSSIATLSLANFEQLEKAQVPHQLSALPLASLTIAFPQVDFSGSSHNSSDENEPPENTIPGSAGPISGFNASFVGQKIHRESKYGALTPLLHPATQPVSESGSHSQVAFDPHLADALNESFDIGYLQDNTELLDSNVLLSPFKSPFKFLHATPEKEAAGPITESNHYLLDLCISPQSFAFP